MKIYNIHDGNTVVRSYTSEQDAIKYAADRCSVVRTELFTSSSRESAVKDIYDLNGMGKGLSVALYGAGPSNATIPQPEVDVVMSANARWDIPHLDFNLYIDGLYSQWLTSGKIKLSTNVQHIAQEGNTPADYWFMFDRKNCGHSGKTLLYVADKICRFEKIYLLGFDYTLGPNRELHANEPEGLCNNGVDDCSEHENRIFECMLDQFNAVTWTTGKIFNLNPKSALKLFPHIELP